jgi:hypothetical protein
MTAFRAEMIWKVVSGVQRNIGYHRTLESRIATVEDCANTFGSTNERLEQIQKIIAHERTETV